MNVERKLRQLEFERKLRQEENDSSDSVGFVFVMLLAAGMYMLGFGMGTGSYQELNYIGNDFNTSVDEPVVAEAQDQEIVFTPRNSDEMIDRTGYVKSYSDNTTMWIQADRPVEEIYQTCNHEELHNRGVLGDEHDYVYDVQDQIYNPVCLEAIYKLGVHKGERR